MLHSTSSGWGTRDLRYQYQWCHCGKKAMVKIVDSEKPTKAMLYFVCEKKEYNFWAWCIPINNVTNETEEVDQTNFSSCVKNEASDGFKRRLKNLEEMIGMMKVLMLGCVADKPISVRNAELVLAEPLPNIPATAHLSYHPN
ncbi:hypothetical protein ACH5RR_012254 [Cinchona calisaya]|uniref:Uncharacterized protein n=1 Tax=Cinchona calisaya TaxID=153742 RepID=A0ABD3AD33_9GENT